jgi:hypothetical protein
MKSLILVFFIKLKRPIILIEKPEGKKSLVRPRCKWEDNIKMDLRE